MESTTSSANWAGVTFRPCGWPGTPSMMHYLLHITNTHCCFCVGDTDCNTWWDLSLPVHERYFLCGFRVKRFVAMKVVKSAEHYTETAVDEIKLLKSVSSWVFAWSNHVLLRYTSPKLWVICAVDANKVHPGFILFAFIWNAEVHISHVSVYLLTLIPGWNLWLTVKNQNNCLS